MSVDTFVFLRDNRLPSRDQWQKALDDVKSGIVLDIIENLRTHVGYLPAKFKGQDSGFEWFYGTVADIFSGAPEGIGDRGHAIDFVTHSDMRELVCALYAAGVLATIADGLFYDEESGEFVPGDRAIQMAKEIEEQEL